MELFEAIYGRKTVRTFKNTPIKASDLQVILDAALQAPSATNRKGWYFIYVHSDSIKKKLVELGGSRVIQKAPAGLLVLYCDITKNYYYNDRPQSVSAAIQNLLLASYEKGIATCWINQLPPISDLKKLFNIPTGYRPYAYVALGYFKKSNEKAGATGRREKLDINDYMGNEVCELKPISRKVLLKFKLTRLLVFCFYKTPHWLRKKLEPYVYKKHVSKF